jgi:hypothetical protein
LVKVGAGVAAAMAIVKFCVASGAVPLLAVTVPVNDPAVVGVPETTPAVLRVKPGGRLPAERAKVGEPVEV